MTQYGFFFDQSRCTGCRDCTVACKNWHQLPPGPLKYLKVYEYEKGSFPLIRLHYQWVPCYHCEEPACVSACPADAIHQIVCGVKFSPFETIVNIAEPVMLAPNGK
jgi:anaerobic dimethyl sulfoxide reductase subunit B (iron-sulfur subunit)